MKLLLGLEIIQLLDYSLAIIIIEIIDTNTLKDISKETGGQFFRATDKEALSQIYARIDELERSEIEVRNFTEYKELFRWFLLPALFLALIYFVLKRYIFKVII